MAVLNYSVSLVPGANENVNTLNTMLNEIKASVNSIVNDQVSNSAAIQYSKLSLANSILNADINSAAAIAHSKLAAVSSGNLLVGNASNVATSVALSGDATLSNAGVLSLAANSVDTAELVDDAVTPDKLDPTTLYDQVALAGSIVSSGSYGDYATVSPSENGTYAVTASICFYGNGGADSVNLTIRRGSTVVADEPLISTLGSTDIRLATVHAIVSVTSLQDLHMSAQAGSGFADVRVEGSYILAHRIG